MASLGNPRWAQLLTRVFGSYGAGGLDTVLPDVMPVASVFEDQEDQRWPRGEHYFQVAQTGAAPGAGQYRTIAFGGPAGVLVVVTRARARKWTSAGNLRVRQVAWAGATAPAWVLARDSRNPGPPPVLSAVTSAGAVGGDGEDFYCAANIWTDLNLLTPYVCAPGAGIALEQQTANEAIDFQVGGYYRIFDPTTEAR